MNVFNTNYVIRYKVTGSTTVVVSLLSLRIHVSRCRAGAEVQLERRDFPNFFVFAALRCSALLIRQSFCPQHALISPRE